VNAPVFRGVRNLSMPQQQLYISAMAAQLALTATRGHLVDLQEQLAQMDLKPGTNARAEDLVDRRRRLAEEVTLVTREADAMQAFQEAKAKLATTQIAALEESATRLASRSSADQRSPESDMSLTRWVRFLFASFKN
jgi:hypothetical protein